MLLFACPFFKLRQGLAKPGNLGVFPSFALFGKEFEVPTVVF